jgi:hypothetical protein
MVGKYTIESELWYKDISVLYKLVKKWRYKPRAVGSKESHDQPAVNLSR